jgi:hypothetical protein
MDLVDVAGDPATFATAVRRAILAALNSVLGGTVFTQSGIVIRRLQQGSIVVTFGVALLGGGDDGTRTFCAMAALTATLLQTYTPLRYGTLTLGAPTVVNGVCGTVCDASAATCETFAAGSRTEFANNANGSSGGSSSSFFPNPGAIIVAVVGSVLLVLIVLVLLAARRQRRGQTSGPLAVFGPGRKVSRDLVHNETYAGAAAPVSFTNPNHARAADDSLRYYSTVEDAATYELPSAESAMRYDGEANKTGAYLSPIDVSATYDSTYDMPPSDPGDDYSLISDGAYTNAAGKRSSTYEAAYATATATATSPATGPVDPQYALANTDGDYTAVTAEPDYATATATATGEGEYDRATLPVLQEQASPDEAEYLDVGEDSHAVKMTYVLASDPTFYDPTYEAVADEV